MSSLIIAEMSQGEAWTIVLATLIVYFVPTLVARARYVPNTGSVFIINLFLGWTFIGWVVALAMAARSTAPTRTTV